MKDSQPDSKRASMLSKVGDAIGKTYNLVQRLCHVLKKKQKKLTITTTTKKADSNLRFSVFDAEHLRLFSSYEVQESFSFSEGCFLAGCNRLQFTVDQVKKSCMPHTGML